MQFSSQFLLFIALTATVSSAFVTKTTTTTTTTTSFTPNSSFQGERKKQQKSTTRLYDGDGTGGWGIGGQRELRPEEFARRGDRSYFDGYQMSTQGDFLRSIQDESNNFKKAELEELLGVARIAGINVKDPSSRLNKFSKDDLFLDEDDDSLDLSV